jgi:hypothetical protein
VRDGERYRGIGRDGERWKKRGRDRGNVRKPLLFIGTVVVTVMIEAQRDRERCEMRDGRWEMKDGRCAALVVFKSGIKRRDEEREGDTREILRTRRRRRRRQSKKPRAQWESKTGMYSKAFK